MRIAIFTPEYAGVTPSTGGIGVNYAALAPELARRGHEIHVLIAGQPPGSIHENGVEIRTLRAHFPGRFPYTRPLFETVALERAIRRLGPLDIIFGCEWGGQGALSACVPRSTPFITNLMTSLEQIEQVQGPQAGNAHQRRLHQVQKVLERRQTRSSDGIAACSTAILRWAQELWGLEGIPAEALPSFIDLDRTRSLAEGRLPDGFPVEGPTVLFFGRLEVRKGVDVLARAMVQVWEMFPETQLVLIGADSDIGGQQMSQRVREIVGPHSSAVRFLGSLPPDQLFPAVAQANVVVFPSLWENFSIAALEARSLGKALVATSGSGFDDFFADGDDGLLVPPGNDPALAQALMRLLGDTPLADRLGQEAAAEAVRYSAAVGVVPYLDFFERVTAQLR